MQAPTLPDRAAALERALLGLQRAEPAAPARDVAQAALTAGELPPDLHARALLLLGIAEHRLDRSEPALRALVQALQVAESVADVRLRIDVLRAIATVHAWRGGHAQALLHLTLAVADCAVLGDMGALAAVLGEMARVNLEMRRWSHALQLLLRQQQLVAEAIEPIEALRLHINMAQAHNGLGAYDAAATLAREVLEQAEALGSTYHAFGAARELAVAHGRAGHADAAQEALGRARAHAGNEPRSWELASLAGVEAEFAAAANAPDAEEAIAGIVEEWSGRGLAAPEIDARLIQAEVLLRRGARADAERTLRLALGRAQSCGLSLLEADVRETMARLGAADGLVEESQRAVNEDFAHASDGYVLLERLGAGTFGTVFRAFDLERAREVALKRMTGFDRYDGELRRRLVDSARLELELAARVVHPGVARVIAIGNARDGTIYVVQDFVRGVTLRELMRQQRDPSFIALTLRRMLLAVAALHGARVVHRDLKPENVVCPALDRPVLVDLGIASALDDDATPHSRGTRVYAAPEQWHHGQVDPRADLFSIGVIGFEWLTGRLPAAMPSLSRFTLGRPRMATGDEGALRGAVEMPGFAELIMALLQHDPARRPGSATAAAATLEELVKTTRT